MPQPLSADQPSLPQHCLNFLPEPQGQGALRPVVSMEKLGLRLGRLSLSLVPAGDGGDEGSMLPELPEVATLSWVSASSPPWSCWGALWSCLRKASRLAAERKRFCSASCLMRVHQGDEQVVGLVLVFDERILLALGAEADAFAQGVHVVKVLLPLLVDGDEHHAALLLVEHFHRQVADAGFVGFLDLVDEHRGDGLLVLAVDEILRGDADRQGGVDPVEQFVVVGLVVVALGEVFARPWRGWFPR